MKLQSGIPSTPIVSNGRRANGLLLRGVVTATYVTDDPGHPQADSPTDQAPVAVYCDVLVFPSLPGQRWLGLRGVLVSQDISGLHRGRIWKPRPTTIDFLDSLNVEEGTNPAYMDGDHVLVGFMNDNLSQPVILRSIPHPSLDLGNEDKALGRRMKLTDVDGDPDFFKHHGVSWGVDTEGNFLINTNYANDGVIDANGKEPPPSGDAGTGNVTIDLPLESKLTVHLNDMQTDPENPDPKLTFSLEDGKVKVEIEGENNIELIEKGGSAKLTLGDGAVSAAVAEHLNTLYTTLKAWLEEIKVQTGMGPSSVPLNIPAPSWDPNIVSDKIKLPDTG